MQRTVLVLGGGMAGLTAAQELIERGFSVTVIEPHKIVGGKSKSISVPGTGTDGRQDLPGEHGFRFFPGFYKHIPDTMRRIPYGDQKVVDNLVNTTEVYISDYDTGATINQNSFWGGCTTFKQLVTGQHQFHKAGVTQVEIELFAEKLWQVFSTCPARRDSELDQVGWWEFTDADQQSETYQQQLVINTTKALVASDPWRASARTIGTIAMQVVQDMMRVDGAADRVLNGPTNDVWIEPWYWYLQQQGVKFIHGEMVTRIGVENGQISEIETHDQAEQQHLYTADEYILAVPVEVAAPLLAPLQTLDDQFKDLQELSTMINWMNGIQYYLYADVPIAHGHEMLPKTKWALTAISQAQFWPETNLAEYADGKVRGILSVDISDWHTPGLVHQKPATACTPKEIAEEVWHQIKRAINIETEILQDSNLHSWFLDPDIQRSDQNPHENVNLEPLLVNLINSWELRPGSSTKIKNMFLAADYVKNNTDLASMEGANEAARRAVNCILDKYYDEHTQKSCKVFPLREPWYARLLQRYDKRRFDRGLPWRARPPLYLFWPVLLFLSIYRIGRYLSK